MRSFVLFAAIAVAIGGTAISQYHDEVYIAGGYNGTTSTLYSAWGIFRYDVNAGTMTTVTVPGGNSYGMAMDHDNRSLVFTVQRTVPVLSSGPTGTGAIAIPGGPDAGLYRYDPTTNRVTTIARDKGSFYRAGKVVVNQDGDYIVAGGTRTVVGSTIRFDDVLLKIDQAGTITTVWTTMQLGRTAALNGAIRVDPDTGNYLVCDYTSSSTTTLRYPILEASEKGATRVWSTGGAFGWDGRYAAPYDLASGEFAGPSGSYVYRLGPGVDARTTLGTIVNMVGGTSLRVAAWDLQSAANRRWVAIGYERYSQDPFENFVYHIAEVGKVAVATTLNPQRITLNHDLVFWRGRHLQTVKTAARRWDIKISAPNHPGQRYAVAMSMRGIRPGTVLPDGRRLFLNLDALSFVTLGNLIPSIFRPGPGVLDANGEASAKLDVRAIPEIGWPFWIAVIVLDPAAPAGIGLVPEPIVIRL